LNLSRFSFFAAAILGCVFAVADNGESSRRQQPARDFTATEIQGVVDSVMSGPDFRTIKRANSKKEKGFLARLLDQISEALEAFFKRDSGSSRMRGGGSVFSSVLLGVMLAIIVAALTAVMILIFRMKGSDPSRRTGAGGFLSEDDAVNPATPPGELAVSAYEHRAMTFAANGDFASAIRELALGSMSWVERAGLIRFRRGLTNRDYVRAVWRDDERRSSFLSITTELEKVFFGRRAATEVMFQTCLTSFRKAFHEQAANSAR